MEHKRHRKHRKQGNSSHVHHSKKVHHARELTEASKIALELVGYRPREYSKRAMHKGSRLVSPAGQEWHKEYSDAMKNISLFHSRFLLNNAIAEPPVPGYHRGKSRSGRSIVYYRKPIKVNFVGDNLRSVKPRKEKAPRKVRKDKGVPRKNKVKV